MDWKLMVVQVEVVVVQLLNLEEQETLQAHLQVKVMMVVRKVGTPNYSAGGGGGAGAVGVNGGTQQAGAWWCRYSFFYNRFI
jgi:hypothetical protein